MARSNISIFQYFNLLIVLLSPLLLQAGGGRLMTAAEGLSSGKTTCLTQDSHGYIWTGTEYGLDRYDGYRHTAYLHHPTDTTSLPDNEVTCFHAAPDGQLWVGLNKGLALYRPDTNDFLTLHFPGQLRPRVETIVNTSPTTLLIGTAGYGLFAVDKRTMTVTRHSEFTRKPADEFASRLCAMPGGTLLRGSHLPTLTVTAPDATAQRDISLGQAGPVVRYINIGTRASDPTLVVCTYGILTATAGNKASKPTKNTTTDNAAANARPALTLTDAGYDLSALGGQASIRTAALAPDGTLYIGTSGRGIFLAPKGSRTFQPLVSRQAQFDLATANVNDILADSHGNLWASCYNKGLFLLAAGHTAFHTTTFADHDIRLGSSVSSIAPDGEGGTWLTVQKSGIYHIDRQGNVTAQRTQPDAANTIYRDTQGRYWLGTESALYAYDTASGQADRRIALDGWGVNCMADDGHGTLYVSNFGKGFIAYDTATRRTHSYSMAQGGRQGRLVNDWVKAMLWHSRGLLLTACADGLSALDPRTGRFTTYADFRGKQCLSLCEMRSSGHVLVGTDKGLYLLNARTARATPFAEGQQPAATAVYGIVEDRRGDIWLATAMGIWQYDHKQAKWIGHIGGSGLATREYMPGAVLHDRRTDAITFGIGDGLTTFRPDDVRRQATAVGTPRLTRLAIGTREAPCTADTYHLSYDDNTFTMEFSLLTFHDTDNVTYEYRLADSDPWTPMPDGANGVTFSRMEPGTYHLQVRAANGAAHSLEPLRLTVTVAHPWYSSPLAWAAYALLAAALVAFIVYYIERRRTILTEEAKMRFLINATHDIRSPLTLILGPLQKLRERLKDDASRDDIDTIDRNAQRLLTLVNQILDERRIDKHQMRLCCQPTSLARQISGICSMYQYNAHQRGITLSFSHPDGDVEAWVDRDNFDKVLANLLSNAFKYTPDGGEIAFTLTRTATHAVISLADTGPGLRGEKTERLFERFYQGRNAQTLHIEGTGIGLNLSRAIVRLHGGDLTAANRSDRPIGAVFEVRLPLGCGHLSLEERGEALEERGLSLEERGKRKEEREQILEERGERREEREQIIEERGKRKEERGSPHRRQRILIVDDDSELAAYVARELATWYHTATQHDGAAALHDLLTNAQPYDLVISDVVMPGMDGLQLLRAIKTNPQLSHTPVILLTSRGEADHRVEGLRKGADGYMAKPFLMEELRAMADNLIDSRQQLRGKFSGAQQQEERREHVALQGNDDALMDRIMRSINAHLAEPDFRVDSLTQDVGISRAQLHRKLKELTGLPAGEFIRNLRMDEAARLLSEGKVTVTQVAYAVGFTSQSHFSTAFHKRFGVSPKEYLGRVKSEE